MGRSAQPGNQTVEWLRRMGRGDIAEKVASGAIPAAQALTLVSGSVPQDPQGPTYAPGATRGQSGQIIAPPLGGDEQQVGRPFPNEPLPQMGASPVAAQGGGAGPGFPAQSVNGAAASPSVPSVLRQRQASGLRNLGNDGVPAPSQVLRAFRAQPDLASAGAAEFFHGVGIRSGEADALAQVDRLPQSERSQFYNFVVSEMGDIPLAVGSPVQSLLEAWQGSAPSAMDRFQGMTPDERTDYLDGLNQQGGARGLLEPTSGAVSGGPERIYQAQATEQDQIPGFNFDDTVTDRRLAGQELDYRTALGRLESIDQQLAENPELLEGMTFSGNLRRQGLAFWERLGFDLSDDSEEYLSDQTSFRQSILRNINRTIQEVTGAQMGEQEARRIRAEMPDVTASPTEFRTQLSNAMNMIRMDAARVQVWRMGGGEGEASSVTDADVMQALRDRGASAYQEALQQGLSTSEARLQAARMLREEFGL